MEETRVLEGDKAVASLAEAGQTVRGKLVRAVLIATGSLSVGLGVVGIVLPLLPTTPFLLLAAACYLRSSRRLHRWLLGNRVVGGYIRRYLDGKGRPFPNWKPLMLTSLRPMVPIATTMVSSRKSRFPGRSR
jgi:uncharacterized protein